MANTEKKPFGPFLHGPPQFGFILSPINNVCIFIDFDLKYLKKIKLKYFSFSLIIE